MLTSLISAPVPSTTRAVVPSWRAALVVLAAGLALLMLLVRAGAAVEPTPVHTLIGDRDGVVSVPASAARVEPVGPNGQGPAQPWVRWEYIP